MLCLLAVLHASAMMAPPQTLETTAAITPPQGAGGAPATVTIAGAPPGPAQAHGVIPWVGAVAGLPATPFATLADLAPLAVLTSGTMPELDTGDLQATLWVGMDGHALYLRVSVTNPVPAIAQSGSDMWQGDSIQVSLDPQDDTSPNLGEEADTLPAGALYAAFALTAQGPRGWAHLRGSRAPGGPGPLDVPMRIVRDAALGQLLYEITVPFSELGTVAGVHASLGLGLQVNEAGPHSKTYRHLTWGGGPSGTFRPGRLHRLLTAQLPPDYVAVAPTRLSIWQDDGQAEVAVVGRACGGLTAEVLWQNAQYRLTLPHDRPGAAASPSRWRLRMTAPHGCAVPERLQVTVLDPNGQIRAQMHDEVTCPAGRLEALIGTLRKRAQSPEAPPLERRMRASQAALLQASWASAQVLLPQSAEGAELVLEAAESLSRATLTHADDWSVYSRGDRPLTLAFVSSLDGSLQPYGLRLPKRWTPTVAQPVVVMLHGKGDPRVGRFLMDLDADGNHGLDDAYILMPWGRGIMGYQGVAEADIFEALDAARRLVALDDARTTLMGFSMGGAGAWSMALHHPDRWAAVAIAAGGTWLTSLGHGLGTNAASLPIAVWHGDADPTVDVSEAYAMRAEMAAAHGSFELHIRPGGGHSFDAALRAQMLTWLLPHRRRLTSDFSYVADDFNHRDRRGVRLRRETDRSAFPSFRCKLTPDGVRIDSEGCRGLDVDLPAMGLGGQGTVQVVWNDKLVYHGAPTTVVLGTGAGR